MSSPHDIVQAPAYPGSGKNRGNDCHKLQVCHPNPTEEESHTNRIQWNERGPLWNHERLGRQPDGRSSRRADTSNTEETKVTECGQVAIRLGAHISGIMLTRRRKSSAGYNLNGLFTGAEGTLGFVTEATLKLAHIPEEYGVAVTTFPSMRSAANAATEVIRHGIPVAAVELLDDVQMDVVNRIGGTGQEWRALPTLFFKFSGTRAGVQDNIDGVRRIVRENGGSDFRVERDPTKQAALWSARKQALWSMMCLREKGSEVWSTDVAVPLSKVPDLVGM